MKKVLIATATLFASLSVQSAVLDTANQVRVLMINGIEITDDQRISNNEYQLPDAETQLVVRVSGGFGTGSDEKFFESKPYLLTFDATKDAMLKLPEFYKNKSKATRAFRNNTSPAWRLTDSNDQVLAYKTELLKGKDGFMPYADIPALVADYNKKHGIAFEGYTLTHQEVAPTQVEDSTVKTLKYWFLDASKEEQQAFLDWAKENKK